MNHNPVNDVSVQQSEHQGQILVVDDSPANLRILTHLLLQEGYQVVEATCGESALAQVHLQRPDLILLDVQMPKVDGFQVSTQLKAQEESRDIPIIFMSAFNEVAMKVKSFEMGGADFIAKPFQASELMARIANQLKILKLQRQLIDQNQQLLLSAERERTALKVVEDLLVQTQQQAIELEKTKNAAESANRAKSEFLANISHEFRTPLTAILGFTQLLRGEQSLSQEHQEFLEIINQSGQHLLNLINDVLEMSKIETGVVELYPKPFDLYRLLDDLQKMLSLKVMTKQLSFIVDRKSLVPRLVITDERRLRQVLLNLLGNAIKLTKQGTVILRIFSEQDVEEGRKARESPHYNASKTLYFEVEDTGPGISPEELDQIFQPFVQAQAGRESQEGTGLGLAISRKFVALMGGHLEVNSIVGQGSIFKFSIQVTLPEENTVPTVLSKCDDWKEQPLLTNKQLTQLFLIQEIGCPSEPVSPLRDISLDSTLICPDGSGAFAASGEELISHSSSQSATLSDRSQVLQPSSLRVMPQCWIAQLYQSARSCRGYQVYQLIEQIPHHHAALTEVLWELAYNYQFEEIVEMIEALDHEFIVDRTC